MLAGCNLPRLLLTRGDSRDPGPSHLTIRHGLGLSTNLIMCIMYGTFKPGCMALTWRSRKCHAAAGIKHSGAMEAV